MELKDRILRRLIVFIMVATIAIPFISPEIFAAAKISVDCGNDVNVGDTFIVRVKYGGEQIGRVDGQLTYDTSKLEYLSGGTSQGDTGYVQLKLAGTDGTIDFNLKFKAVAEGSTDLEITTNEIYDFGEMPLDPPSLTKSVDIVSGGGGGGPVKSDDSKEEAKATEDMSSYENDVEYLDGADEEGGVNITMIIIISAIVIIVLIIIIGILLRRKR